MDYRVLAETSSGLSMRPTSHATSQEALAKAIELMAQGLAKVVIVDSDGRRWTAAEFATELNDAADLSFERDDYCDWRR
jgi:hypothetical protein